MFWGDLSEQATVFFLIFARIFAMFSVAPLFSSSSLPKSVRVGFALTVSILMLPNVNAADITNLSVDLRGVDGLGLPVADAALVEFGLGYVFLLVGEAFIGIIQGFFLQMITAVFQTAGEFFSTQMGFGASVVFDPLAQQEVPLMGQFFNLVAMLVFLLVDGFQKLFFSGVLYSFNAVHAADLVRARGVFMGVFAGGLSLLFRQAIAMAFPIFGTLFLVSITMGLLAKAAPQMNLLMLGFPLAIIVAFSMLIFVIPLLMNSFAAVFENAFSIMEGLLMDLRGGAR